jgi:DNA-binding transcriptional LysR family regulator
VLNLARIRLLVELDRLGTVAAVADALDYTPSAVSQQLAQLERETGPRPLLEKVGRRLRLTDAGQLLAAHGRDLIAHAEAAEAELSALSGLAGTLRIAAFETAARELVMPAIGELAERHPELTCELLDLEAEEALPLLSAAELDVVIAEEYEHAPRPRLPGIDRRELLDDALLVALHPKHPLAKRATAVRIAELADEPWAAPRHRTAYADMLLRACRSEGGFEPDFRHRVNDMQTILALVAAGLAVALVPELGHPERHGGVVVRALAGRGLSRSVFASVRTGAAERPAVRALLDAMLSPAPVPPRPARGSRAGRPATSARRPGRRRSAGS